MSWHEPYKNISKLGWKLYCWNWMVKWYIWYADIQSLLVSNVDSLANGGLLRWVHPKIIHFIWVYYEPSSYWGTLISGKCLQGSQRARASGAHGDADERQSGSLRYKAFHRPTRMCSPDNSNALVGKFWEERIYIILLIVLFHYIPIYAFGWVKDTVHTKVEKVNSGGQLHYRDGQRPYRLSRVAPSWCVH